MEQNNRFLEGGSKAGDITNAILFMLAKDCEPFYTVEHEGFKHLMKVVVPLYSIPSRTTITRKMGEKYDFLATQEKKKLEQIQHFCVTTDIWTDTLNTKSYLGMTIH